MTLRTYRAFKRMHKRAVRLRGWYDEQEKWPTITGVVIGASLAFWLILG